MSSGAPNVFISYRREETAGHAGRLYDAMVARFGESSVFMDIALEAGVDFVDRITQAVGDCDVLLVIIGPRWATLTNGEPQPRLMDPEDFVRLEVATALGRSDVTVIPLLVAGARMPDPDELPADLRTLARRNAFELSDQRWRYDVDRLTSRLQELLVQDGRRPETGTGRPVPWRLVAAVAVGLLALAAIAAGIAAIVDGGSGSSKTPKATPIENVDCPTNCSQPSVQPDGGAVAFIRSNQGPIYVADLDGARASNPTPVESARHGIRPSLAKTGQLAYQDQSAGGIWYTDEAHERPARLATGFDPSWSQNASELVFSAQQSKGYALFTAGVPARGKPVLLMPSGAGSTKDSVPAWSPDGERIAFIRSPIGDCTVARGDVWIVSADGTDAHRLVALTGDERHPTWSPDSEKVAFSSDAAERGNYDLYTVDADGSHLVRRTRDAKDDVGPSWGADGIVYTRGTFECTSGGANQRLWFLPLGG